MAAPGPQMLGVLAPSPPPGQAEKQVPQQQEQHAQPAQQAQQVVHWSHFNPEFSWKLEEDVDVHLLHTYDWMNTLYFIGHTTVQRFWLTLILEARLWYQSSESIKVDWQGLQNLFR